MDKTENNKRIAKNTVILYGRMLVMMFVGFYTSRVVIDALGFTDYGIYNVVGSVVAIFSVLSHSISGAISRFFTFELGRGDMDKLRTIFSMSINILLIAGLTVAFVAEIGGAWYIHHKMVLPPERIEAALWVFHCSIIGFVVSLLTVPYNAAIVAHERMSVYAYMSFLDIGFKLLIVFLTTISPFDKLISYALLGLGINIFMRLVYSWYCGSHFQECHYRLLFDKPVFKSMGAFAGWNLFGSLTTIARDQGMDILLNSFCGPIVNAARGIANTVSAATRSLAGSFMASSRPQITKAYAAGDLQYSFSLVIQCTKLAFGLMLLIILPILIDARYVLSLWLVEIPDHAVWFVRLTLINTIADTFNSALNTLMQATGNIKRYQTMSSVLFIANLPICYLLLSAGIPPEATIAVIIVTVMIVTLVNLNNLKRLTDFPVTDFVRGVWLRALPVVLLASVVPMGIYMACDESFLRLLLIAGSCVSGTILTSLYIGCDKGERDMIFSYAKRTLMRWKD